MAQPIHGTALDITGALLLFVVGMPLAVVLALSALAWVPALAVPFSVPWPVMGYVLTIHSRQSGS